eukprot:3973041-Ditylum_brightwellii.AAC.1
MKENVGGNSTCNSIFDDGPGLCLPFEADFCLLPDFTFAAMPSAAPSSTLPSSVPSDLPSSVPSEMPSIY